MAVLRIEDGELALHLSAAEKVGAVHGDLRIPLSAVRRVEVLEDAHEPADHGPTSIRATSISLRCCRVHG